MTDALRTDDDVMTLFEVHRSVRLGSSSGDNEIFAFREWRESSEDPGFDASLKTPGTLDAGHLPRDGVSTARGIVVVRIGIRASKTPCAQAAGMEGRERLTLLASSRIMVAAPVERRRLRGFDEQRSSQW